MKYFNIPADFRNETIDRYDQLNSTYTDSKVIETYGQITIGNIVGSGRAYDLIPEINLQKLKDYIEYSKKKKIEFNYTLNTTCVGNMEFTKEGIAKIIGFLDDLYAAGVRSLTISLPSLIELVRVRKYDFEIKASTVCQIINANKALNYKNMGVDKIVVDESINRNFDALKRIRNAFGEEVEVITNVICHQNCVYEMFHHNQTSHDMGGDSSKPSATFYSHRCMMKRCESVSSLLKLAWIRPEDMKHYTSIGISYFKLQGRQAVLKGDPVRATECYMKERFDGNLVELLDMFSPTNSFMPYLDNRKLDGFIKPFIEKQDFCKNDCSSCNYCEAFIKNCTDYEKTEEIFKLASKFYKEYDQFINMVQSSQGQNMKKEDADPVKKLFEEKELNVDFD